MTGAGKPLRKGKRSCNGHIYAGSTHGQWNCRGERTRGRWVGDEVRERQGQITKDPKSLLKEFCLQPKSNGKNNGKPRSIVITGHGHISILERSFWLQKSQQILNPLSLNAALGTKVVSSADCSFFLVSCIPHHLTWDHCKGFLIGIPASRPTSSTQQT